MPNSDPVFIHGILQRSGTNFLFDLLRVHPDLAPAREPVYEDMFLQQSDGLFHFVERVRATWNPSWNVPKEFDDQLLACIGDGLLSFLTTDPERRLLVKNPRVDHLSRFFALFPTGRLVLLLRDGRSVVQSGMASFGVDLAYAARLWAKGADSIADFLETSEGRSRSLVVRYEDLVDDLRPQLEGILDFCGLNRSSYDFERAERLPVRGSSQFSGPGASGLHWEPVESDHTFDPRRRWQDWSSAMHDEFWAIAGVQMHRLGYTDGAPSGE